MAVTQIIIGLILAASFYSAPPTFQSPLQPKTVQISIDTNAAVLITTSKGKQIGFDSKADKSVNEILEARIIERENASTFILPYDKTVEDYTLAISSKDPTQTANISMTGPGFVIGVRNLMLRAGEVQSVSLSSAESHDVSIRANRDGPTPTLFLTTQTDRSQPSYRFEVSSSSLERDKSIWIEIDMSHRWLFFGSSKLFGSNETRKTSFAIMMRRTNPGGLRETYTQRDISFGSEDLYRMDFGEWDGKGEIRFCQAVAKGAQRGRPREIVSLCQPLKNETAQ